MTFAPRISMVKTLFYRVMLICALGCLIASPALSESTQQLQNQIEKLQKLADTLSSLHSQLQINKNDVFLLHERATDNIQGNILTDAEMSRIRDERRQVLSQIEKRTPELAQQRAVEDQLAAEMTEWRRRQEERQGQATETANEDGRGPGMGERFSNDRFITETPGETSAQREQERAARIEMEQQRLAREKDATVYVDSDCPRIYVAGDTGVFLALIAPDDVSGYFTWRLDDNVIGHGPTLRYTFSQVGVYDLSVDLSTKWGHFEDHYVDQIRVDPAPPSPLPPAYPPEMEGQQTMALDLPFCKYWTLFEGGKIRITGHYFAPSGQKVAYESLPIANYSPVLPTAGMFVLASGTGYHVYQTEKKEEETDAAAVYIITRMKGPEVTILHRLPVKGSFQMTPAPDNLSWTINYKDEIDSTQKKLILR